MNRNPQLTLQLSVNLNTAKTPVKVIWKKKKKKGNLFYFKFLNCSLTYSAQRYLSICVYAAAFPPQKNV